MTFLYFGIIIKVMLKKFVIIEMRQIMQNLSEREKIVLKFLVEGIDNKHIGENLNISIHTVKSYIANILRKFEAKNRTQVAFIAGKNNIVE